MSGFAVAFRLDGEPPPPKPAAPAWKPSRAALQLALAHKIERAIDAGQIKDYAEAARVLGVTRARVAQIVALAQMPAAEQEAALLGQTSALKRSRGAQRRRAPQAELDS